LFLRDSWDHIRLGGQAQPSFPFSLHPRQGRLLPAARSP
jgi:hypothetical protein